MAESAETANPLAIETGDKKLKFDGPLVADRPTSPPSPAAAWSWWWRVLQRAGSGKGRAAPDSIVIATIGGTTQPSRARRAAGASGAKEAAYTYSWAAFLCQGW
jgi:hypothetical protein